MLRRVGASEKDLLAVQSNLSNIYQGLGREEEGLLLKREVYSKKLKIYGMEHRRTLLEAYNLANTLLDPGRYEEAKALLRKTMPVARRVLEENDDTTLRMRWLYAMTLHRDDDATLDDVREAVETLEETERIARRVFGGAHPLVADFERTLRDARAALRARETLAEAMASTTLGDA